MNGHSNAALPPEIEAELEARLDRMWQEVQDTLRLQVLVGERVRLLRVIWFRRRVGRN